jgi:hypothetical protein
MLTRAGRYSDNYVTPVLKVTIHIYIYYTSHFADSFTCKTASYIYNMTKLIIIITLQDRTRTVCDSLHVGRHSLRGIDG